MMATALTIDPMLSHAYLVREIAKETADTFTLKLTPEFNKNGATFQPGQFSMLWVFGVGELPISISGDPDDHGELVYTVRSVGQATNGLVTCGVGDAVGVRGPFGIGWPMEAARGRDVIIVAGGIGLAPLRPVIYEVLNHRKDYGRLVLLYGARSPHDLLYRKELTSWSRQKETQVLTTVDYGGMSWRGHVGVVTTLFKYARLKPSRSVAMVCGPEIMMRFVTRELEMNGLSRNDIYLSMERNMKCAIGFCGHCQYGPHFICKEGPVFRYEQLRTLLDKYEL
ncbi:MAG TPA: FAD/NAD(P)-binding protein [Candidatus Sulfotelmatobacter sp.]|nr:FAD/NAD(P)-binding protein [Candidatus Sulfotelmatobacter sp.]